MTVEAAIQADLDALLLPWQDVSARRMFGGNGYFVGDRLFAVFIRASWLPSCRTRSGLRYWTAISLGPSPLLPAVPSANGWSSLPETTMA